jgi:hypothetical protein
MKINENYRKAISVLDPNGAREDHCDGGNAIYRLAAFVDLDLTMSLDGLKRYLKKLTKQLSGLSTRPNVILIMDNMIEISWYAKEFQVVMNRGQYAGLALQFAKFLNESRIENIRIQEGCFNDDPEADVKKASDKEVNFFPEFNNECFGANPNEPIRIFNFNDKYGDWGETSWL